MPLMIPDKLPAIEQLKKENIFVMGTSRAQTQDIRPLKLVVLNLMPMKVVTETELVRLLSNTPLQIDVEFLRLQTHVPKNTSMDHMRAFYYVFDQIKDQKYDGMIVTGSPLEQMEFEEISSWKEMEKIFDWARTHVTSTLFICWAAFAGLYHNYGIRKYALPEKMFGVFKHTPLLPLLPVFRGFDDYFYVPHSRHTEVRKEDILKHSELQIAAESDEAGVYMVIGRGGREIYVTGHAEYDLHTLDSEYRRDLSRGLPIHMPKHYYRNDDPAQGPVLKWRSYASLFYQNWLNYYVYQETPYDLSMIK